MKKELLQKLARSGLLPYQDMIFSTFQPALHIATKRNDQLEIGSSKFGGYPDLPSEVVYPTYGEGKKQTFLAQFQLSDLASFSVSSVLPSSGMLYFFHVENPTEDGYRELSWQCPWEGWQVIYWDGDPTTLQPTIDDHHFAYPQAEIQLTERYSCDEDRLYDEMEDLPSHIWDEIEKIKENECIGLDHQLLGYPTLQQPLYGEKDVKERILLLQLDSDSEVEMLWGDCGTLYFFTTPEDLQKRDFSKIFYEYQWG